MSWAVNMSQIKAARYSLFGRVGDRKTGATFAQHALTLCLSELLIAKPVPTFAQHALVFAFLLSFFKETAHPENAHETNDKRKAHSVG